MMNNDRFKFRVAIPVEYGGENADGISTTLIIHNAVPHSNGNVCVFGIDELDAALERAGINDERDICQIHEYMYANFLRSASHDYFMADFMADIDCLDQCTGMKDKNGNLIYESDIIHDLGEIEPVCTFPFVVKWSDRSTGFYLDHPKQGMRTILGTLDSAESHNYEIIGNIYKTKGWK